MPGYSGIIDWTGLPCGVPGPSAGYDGIVDWTGLPCGVPVTDPAAGYGGIVDWTGIPCGAPVPAPSPHRHLRPADGRWYEYRRQHEEEQEIAALIALLLADE